MRSQRGITKVGCLLVLLVGAAGAYFDWLYGSQEMSATTYSRLSTAHLTPVQGGARGSLRLPVDSYWTCTIRS